jgi:hypothetical protein
MAVSSKEVLEVLRRATIDKGGRVVLWQVANTGIWSDITRTALIIRIEGVIGIGHVSNVVDLPVAGPRASPDSRLLDTLGNDVIESLQAVAERDRVVTSLHTQADH